MNTVDVLKNWVVLLLVTSLAACGSAAGNDQPSEQTGALEQALTTSIRIEAEDYVAFFERSPASNAGGACDRGDGVDKQLTQDPSGGGCNIGWTDAGEWLEYRVTVDVARAFDVSARVASAYAGRTFHFELDGQSLAGELTAPSAGWQAFADRTTPSVVFPAGEHRLRVVFDTGLVNLNYLTLTPSDAPVPARIEAEDYRRFRELTPQSNAGGACDRGDGVDKERTADPAGGNCNVGWVDAGEWLEYDIFAEHTALFDITARVASAYSGKALHLELDGRDVSGSLVAPSRGWQAFEDRTASNVAVSAGHHALRVVFDTSLLNLNYLNLSLAHARLIPARIEAEDYVRFRELTPQSNAGGACDRGDGVDKQLTLDSNGGNCNIGWVDAGEWLEYDIFAEASGSFDISARVASAYGGKSFHLELDGHDVSGALIAPSNGWQAFEDRVASGITLGAGVHRLRVVFDTNLLNLNYLAVSPAATSILELRHDGATSRVHAMLQDPQPFAGEQLRSLPPLAENLVVSADDVTLPYELVRDPNLTELQARFTVPAAVTRLRLEYDIVDGSLPYEGLWYLRHPIAVSGPRQVRIQLPAGAAVNRLDWPDTDADPERISFDLSPGEYTEPFVVYSTPSVPDLYDHIDTPHFTVNIAQAHRRYQPALLGLLENLYALYGEYTGQDVNAIQGQTRYSYSFPPAHWRWGGYYEIPGGLSIKGLSTVNAALIPMIELPTSNSYNVLVAVAAHELGNGWWGAWEEADPENHTPAWINNEGHSGFLRSQGELDLGYCADDRREHSGHYADFLSCLAGTSECGGYIPLVSLRERFGWGPFRAFYAAVQQHAFDFRGLSEVERSSLVIRFFSEQVGGNLVPFFDAAHVNMTAAIRDELNARFPAVDVPFLSDLDCRPDRLRVTPDPVESFVASDATTAQANAFVCAPGGFSVTASPSTGLSLLAPASPNCTTVTVDANLTQTGFGQVAQLSFAAPALLGSPQVRPLIFTPVTSLLQNGGFEQDLGGEWDEVSFLPSATFTRDGGTPHGGSFALRIDAPEENDARVVQVVPVSPGGRYRLSGWIRTEAVELGLGANLSVEWPGTGWQTSAGTLGTTGWTHVSLEVDAGASDSLQVQARLGHYGLTSRGTAWFDDLRFEPLP